MFDTPAESAHEPEEEGRGLKVLHTLVADLAADVRDGSPPSCRTLRSAQARPPRRIAARPQYARDYRCAVAYLISRQLGVHVCVFVCVCVCVCVCVFA